MDLLDRIERFKQYVFIYKFDQIIKSFKKPPEYIMRSIINNELEQIVEQLNELKEIPKKNLKKIPKKLYTYIIYNI